MPSTGTWGGIQKGLLWDWDQEEQSKTGQNSHRNTTEPRAVGAKETRACPDLEQEDTGHTRTLKTIILQANLKARLGSALLCKERATPERWVCPYTGRGQAATASPGVVARASGPGSLDGGLDWYVLFSEERVQNNYFKWECPTFLCVLTSPLP